MMIGPGTRRRASRTDSGRKVITRNNGSSAGARMLAVAFIPASVMTAPAQARIVIDTGSCEPLPVSSTSTPAPSVPPPSTPGRSEIATASSGRDSSGRVVSVMSEASRE